MSTRFSGALSSYLSVIMSLARAERVASNRKLFGSGHGSRSGVPEMSEALAQWCCVSLTGKGLRARRVLGLMRRGYGGQVQVPRLERDSFLRSTTCWCVFGAQRSAVDGDGATGRWMLRTE
jgi:hypothetical protein